MSLCLVQSRALVDVAGALERVAGQAAAKASTLARPKRAAPAGR